MGERFRLSAGRWVAVNTFIAFVVGMQLLDVVRHGERWPFAPYAMYASEHGADITWYQVYGVTAGGEFPLDQERFHSPLDDQRLSFSFAPRPLRRGLVIPPTNDMLRVVGRLYERGRAEGRHDGPRLTGLRLYEVTWKLDPTLANREHPTRRVLLGEVPAGE